MEMREKNQSHVAIPTLFQVKPSTGKTDIKLLFGNAGNNEENNCKPDRSELLCHWLVKDK
jgi:hypothetical protein